MRWYSDSPRPRTVQIVADLVALAVLVVGILLGRALHDAIAALRAAGANVAASGTGFARTMNDIGEQLGGVPLIGGGIRAPFDAAGDAGSTLADAGKEWQAGVERIAALAGWTVVVLVVLFLASVWLRPRLTGAIRRGRLARLAGADGGDDLLALRALLTRPRDALAVAPDAVAAWRDGDAEVVRRLAALELDAAGVRPPRANPSDEVGPRPPPFRRPRASTIEAAFPPGRAGRFRLSGHSKWATTKHQKAVKDARRAKSFAKLIKNIEVAAKIGGADLSGNPTLVDAVQKAKKTSVPNDNIDRAIKRGAGLTGESIDYQTIMYEGYGPAGVALLVECLTDNRNRAAAEVRTAMSRNGGTMADPGSVAYNFSRKGVIRVAKTDGLDEDTVLTAVLDAGVEDVADRGDEFEVVTEPSDLVAARTALQSAGIDYESAEAEFVPGVSVELDDVETARKVLRLVDALEDSDDVQNVFANFDLSDEVAAALDED